MKKLAIALSLLMGWLHAFLPKKYQFQNLNLSTAIVF